MNYAKNQNIYNSEYGAKMATGELKPKIVDQSQIKDFVYVETANGKVKEYDNGIFKLRYNFGYGYWVSEIGTLYYEEDGELKLYSKAKYKKVAASELNNYARKTERYYYMVPNRGNQSYRVPETFVHFIVSYVWAPVGGLRYEKEGQVVDHIDGDSLNNRPENLQYLTFAENIAKYQRGEG